MCNWYVQSNYGNKRLCAIAILSVDISMWLVNLSPDARIMSSKAG